MNRTVLAAAGAGLVAGVAGSLIGNLWLGSRRAPETVQYVPPTRQEATQVREAVVALALASASQPQPSVSAPPQPTPEQPLPPGSELEMRVFSDALAKHEREPENPTWATRVNKGLSADLEKLSADAKISHFELKCRSESCAGTIEWPSPLAARMSMDGLLHNQYTINSAIRFGLPNHIDGGPYRVGVIFVPAPGT
jgi:hypothetical protein